MGVGGLVALGALGLISPPGTTATKPLPAIVPLSQAAFTTTIAAGQELDAPVELAFSGPMDQTSVAASLDVQPATRVRLTWDPTGSRVTVNPASRWQPGAYYTITVRAGALGASGRPMAKPARAVFLTRDATTVRIAATALSGDVAAVSTGFTISFDRPVAIGAVRKALAIEPAVRGALNVVASAPGTSTYVFTPSEVLATETPYSVGLGPLLDASGAPVAETPAFTVTTTSAPAVVRFRPMHNTASVERGSVLSVRFTESMDRKSTKRAWVVTANGQPVAGTVSFAEKDSVLVFRPAAPLPYGAVVEMLVKDTARSAAGAPLEAARSVRFRVQEQPKVATPARSKTTSSTIPRGSSGGGSVGGGSWGAVETYYLRLMNCTRTGGWVTSSGSCSQPRRPQRRGPLDRQRHQLEGQPAVRQATRDERPVQPLHRRQPRRPAPCRGLLELHLGREPRLPLGQPVQRGPRVAPLLPERAVVQRRPLREPDERQVRPRRDRRVGVGRPRPARDRLLPPPLTVIRNAVLHLQNEQPLLVDLFEIPKAEDQGLVCTNLRMMDGKRPIFVDRIESVFFFPYLHIRFLEIPPDSSGLAEVEAPSEEAAPAPAETPEPEEDLELDEDFLRRIREV